MANTPSSEPLETTSGTQTTTTDMPTPQLWDLGTKTYKADVGSNAHQFSGSANPTATSVIIPLNSISPEGNILFDARSATVVIVNGATAQTITDAHLQFIDTVGSQSIVIDYPVAGIGQWSLQGGGSPNGSVVLGRPMTIAPNSYATFNCPIDKGILKNMQLVLTFGGAPSAGTVNAQVNLQSVPVGKIALRPMLLFTATYSDVANGYSQLYINGVWRRDSTVRTLHFKNKTNQNTGSIYLMGYDSTVWGSDNLSLGGSSIQALSGVNAGNYSSYSDSPAFANSDQQTSERAGFAAVEDGCRIQVTNGTTSPTTGTFEVWATQVLG